MTGFYIHKSSSFDDAKKYDNDYYRSMTAEERVSLVQELRGQMKYLSGGKDECSKGLRRYIKVIQQKQS